ncbi:MAG: hypothetical protein HF982_09380 [Desulfobacteraceae bacterium]|nr:hypothetical protein [Desulfobacteraceae bacterium]MBC2719781.1 right-handed parallel beta-helix repeat-containing protein [Desulfobacteraceae bacterium]
MIFFNRLILTAFLIVMLCFIFGESLSFAGEHYVSTSGTASWNDSTNINTPCSGSTAFDNAQAGDIVYFREGTYKPEDDVSAAWTSKGIPDKWEIAYWSPSNSGINGSPITFQAYDNETVTLISDDSVSSAPIGSNSQHYIVFDGFSGNKENAMQMVTVRSGNNIIVQNCIFGGYDQGAIGTQNIIIQYYNSDNSKIINCKISDSMGGGDNNSGIQMYYCDNVEIYNNTISNCYTGVYDKRENKNISVYKNIFLNNLISWYFQPKYASTPRVGIKVYQNLFIETPGEHISFVAAGDVGGTCPGVKIYNNTFYSTGKKGVIIDPNGGKGITDLEFYNNIIVVGTTGIYVWLPNGLTTTIFNYNCYYDGADLGYSYTTIYNNITDWQNNTGYDNNSIIANPLFVKAGGLEFVDYKLKDNSPCKGTGKDGKDIGAYPNGDDGTIIGYVETGKKEVPDVVAPPENPRIQ